MAGLTWEIVGLGLFTGFTIFLGLPVARAGGLSDRTRASLAAIAVGILLFLFVDVLSNAHAIVVASLGTRSSAAVLTAGGNLVALLVGFSVGVVSLLGAERLFTRRLRRGAAEPGTIEATPIQPLHLSTMIAVGIGLHNLSEGLAIGAAFSAGLPLAVVLVVGFAAHNSTEGFGILAPGMMAGSRYSLRRLAALGLIGGGPTFVGTVVGALLTSDVLSVVFYGLAAGAILYVVLQMSRPMLAPATKNVVVMFVVVGFLLGVLTDFLVTLGGG
ncbi:MAG TPA: ZIP family metal transporter [Thermoplasmata archaeon]|nr:ZIP family metal transporter [Thermoplasmata archaeon]